jgi:hypothetical protein
VFDTDGDVGFLYPNITALDSDCRRKNFNLPPLSYDLLKRLAPTSLYPPKVDIMIVYD